MKLIRTLLMVLWMVQGTLFTPLALAQLPPHPPGTICKTPRFWCWVKPPGPVGQPCQCPSPYGPISGVYA